MENKYYTPTLEEFHVGFEYEQYVGTDWEKLIFDIDYEDEDWNDLYHVNFCINRSTIRVKYLNKEDIESLGWYPGGLQGLNEDSFTYNEYQLYWQDNQFIEIYDFRSSIVFQGTIKNKSELVKLLKQLGIC